MNFHILKYFSSHFYIFTTFSHFSCIFYLILIYIFFYIFFTTFLHFLFFFTFSHLFYIFIPFSHVFNILEHILLAIYPNDVPLTQFCNKFIEYLERHVIELVIVVISINNTIQYSKFLVRKNGNSIGRKTVSTDFTLLPNGSWRPQILKH